MSENAGGVIALDRKLALARLDLAGETLFAGASEAIADIWRVAAALLPDVGERAVTQPLLEAWISAGERLAGRGIHRRYAGAHPLRHLHELSQIVAGWASAAAVGAQGTVFLGPCGVIPLWFGSALLVSGAAWAEKIAWRRYSDVIEFTRSGGTPIATVSAVGDSVSVCGGWTVLRLPRVGGIIVDTRTPAYAGDDAAGPAPRGLDRVLDLVLTTLDASEREAVAATYTAAARALPSVPWVAGLLRCPEDLDAAALRRAMRDDHDRRTARIQTLLGKPDGKASAVVLELGGIDEVPRLTLRKTRSGDHGRVEDWSAIDTLAPLSDAIVESLARSCGSASEEGAAYLAAVCAYRLGRFEESRGALARCIAIDGTVEEYWHLLAFAERHLGHYDRFERLVFARERAL